MDETLGLKSSFGSVVATPRITFQMLSALKWLSCSWAYVAAPATTAAATCSADRQGLRLAFVHETSAIVMYHRHCVASAMIDLIELQATETWMSVASAKTLTPMVRKPVMSAAPSTSSVGAIRSG